MGLLPIVLDAKVIDQLFAETEAAEGYQLTVDLEAQQLKTPAGETFAFEVDEFRKFCLLNGFDDIGLTLQHADAIRTFETQHKQTSPWLF